MKTLTDTPRPREPRLAPIEPVAEPDVFDLVPIRVDEIAHNEEQGTRRNVREPVERRFQLD